MDKKLRCKVYLACAPGHPSRANEALYWYTVIDGRPTFFMLDKKPAAKLRPTLCCVKCAEKILLNYEHKYKREL